MTKTDIGSNLSEAQRDTATKRLSDSENGALDSQNPVHRKHTLEPKYPDFDDDLFENVPI